MSKISPMNLQCVSELVLHHWRINVFWNESNAKILSSFLCTAETVRIEDNIRKVFLSRSNTIIRHIYKNPIVWDEKCPFNIKKIGELFIHLLDDFDQRKVKEIDDIYLNSYRFLFEHNFIIGPEREVDRELNSIIQEIQADKDKINNDLKYRISYASYVMPVDIMKELSNDSFKNIDKKHIEIESLKKKWDEKNQNKYRKG